MEILGGDIGQVGQAMSSMATGSLGGHQIQVVPDASAPSCETVENGLSLAERGSWASDILIGLEAGDGMEASSAAMVLASALGMLSGIVADKVMKGVSVDEATVSQLKGAIDGLKTGELSQKKQALVEKMGHLALDILENPEKTKGFVDGEGSSLGKKAARNQLKECLKKLKPLLEKDNLPTEVKESLRQFSAGVKTASKAVGRNLNRARGAKTLNYTVDALSAAATIMGCVTTAGVTLIPELIRTTADVLGSINDIAMSELESHENIRSIVEQPDGALDTPIVGLNVSAQSTIKNSNDLALDVLKHPKKSRGFVDGEGNILGKKATQDQLKRCLDNFDFLTGSKGSKISPEDMGRLDLIRQDIRAAYRAVSRKLNKARAIKTAKIGGATLAIVASAGATLVTFGAGAPAAASVICTACGIVGTTIGTIKTGHELLKPKK
jgi:hypothetical protein